MIKKNIFRVMSAVLFACFLIYMACNKDALEIPPPTQSESSFFKTEGEFRTAIIGAYAKLTDFFSTTTPQSFGSAPLTVWYLPGDDLTQNGSQDFEFFKGINPSQGKLNQIFKSSYGLIARCNKVLEKLEEADNSIFTTPNMKQYMEGELLFLRSFSHFMLWNIFGTAPVDTIVVKSTSQFNPPSSKNTELLDQAIFDLTKAQNLLPTSAWDAKNTGRITANAARALLGKVYVFRASSPNSHADYQAAITAFNSITGGTLVADFGDNFEIDHENNPESLFEFQAGLNISQNQNSWLANDECDCGTSGAYYQMFYQGGGSYMSDGPYLTTVKLRNIYNAADPRLPLTLSADKTRMVKYVVNGDVENNHVSFNNHRVLRYADVLLLKAEAVLQSGGSTSEAIGLVNQVRTRARNMVGGGTEPANLNTAETNTTTIMQWIMDERLRELTGEGHRWHDLRRWHMAGYITLNNAFFSSEVPANMGFQEHFIYFPIPDGETSKNPNIVQNPGY
jgi:starch-binding outer membrane protein, SusD/RagB family